MAVAVAAPSPSIAWWREPTKDQWFALASSLSCMAALLFNPETKGKVLASELMTSPEIVASSNMLAAEV